MTLDLKLDANYARPISVRMSRSTWQAIEQCRQQFTDRDCFPYSFSAVMVFLLETYLYERSHIPSPPVLRGHRAHQLTRRQLEDEVAALRQKLSEAIHPKPQETL